MKSSIITRIILLPFGLLIKLFDLAKDGARDIHNRFRFKDANIDANCCINEFSEIDPNARLFKNCIIINSKISSFSYVSENCLIQNATIGKYCSIANDVLIGLGKHPLDNFSTSPLFYRVKNSLKFQLVTTNSDFIEYEPITIGNDVWIGTRAIILDGVSVGDGAVIAANSVVTKNVPPYAIVGGVPAKIIKYRFSEEKMEKLMQSEWWKWDIHTISKQMNELNNK